MHPDDMHSSYQIDLRTRKDPESFRAVEYAEPESAGMAIYPAPLFSRFVAFSLVLLLLVMPVFRAHADIVSPEALDVAQGAESESEDAPVSETVIPDDQVPPEESNESAVFEDTENAETQDEEISEDAEESTDTDTEISPVSEDESVSPPEEIVVEEEETVETLSDTEEQSETAEPAEESAPAESVEPEREPEPEPGQEAETSHAPVVDDSMFSFSKQDCVVVSEEEFYCTKESSENASTATRIKNTAAVVSRADAEGDLEIFFEEGGVSRQITNNTFDDSAPAFDATSYRIVWHALVNDRYQIFFHDVATNVTLQVTDATFNNTNPDIHGDVVVWQAWEDDNWEIMTARISGPPYSFEIERISWDARPDMFPHVYGNFITWQANTDSGWQSYGYDLGLKETRYVGEGTNGDITSARLVFLVERRNENGDIERVGYELESGEEIPLGSTPEAPALPLPSAPLDGETSVIPETSTTTKTLRTDGGEDDTDTDPGDEPFEPDTFVE